MKNWIEEAKQRRLSIGAEGYATKMCYGQIIFRIRLLFNEKITEAPNKWRFFFCVSERMKSYVGIMEYSLQRRREWVRMGYSRRQLPLSDNSNHAICPEKYIHSEPHICDNKIAAYEMRCNKLTFPSIFLIRPIIRTMHIVFCIYNVHCCL